LAQSATTHGAINVNDDNSFLGNSNAHANVISDIFSSILLVTHNRKLIFFKKDFSENFNELEGVFKSGIGHENHSDMYQTHTTFEREARANTRSVLLPEFDCEPNARIASRLCVLHRERDQNRPHLAHIFALSNKRDQHRLHVSIRASYNQDVRQNRLSQGLWLFVASHVSD
jgi:hypothetical protein